MDLEALHANIYPTLPLHVPDDPRQYLYLKIELPSGNNTIIGQPWVKQESIVSHGKSKVTFTIENVTGDDLKTISQLLSSRGFSAINWELQ